MRNRFGRQKVLGNGHRLRLQTNKSPSIYVKVCPRGISMIPAQMPTNTVTPTIPACQTNIRSYSSIRGSSGHVRTIEQRRKNIRSRSCWNVPLLRKMCGRLNATSAMNTRHTKSKPNQKYDEKNQAIP